MTQYEYYYETRSAKNKTQEKEKLWFDTLYRTIGTKDSTEQCKLLIARKEGLAYINTHYNCFNVLHKAVYRNCELDIVKALLKAHPQLLNTSASKGDTCLHFAIRNGNVACFALLIAHGAQVNVISKKYGSPVQMILALSRSAAAVERDDAKQALQFALLAALPTQTLRTVQRFKQRSHGGGLDDTSSSLSATTILSYMIIDPYLRKNHALIKHLLALGADPYACDAFGKSAIARAQVQLTLKYNGVSEEQNLVNLTNLRQHVRIFQSSAVCLALCGAIRIKRIGCTSPIRRLPMELLRLLKDML